MKTPELNLVAIARPGECVFLQCTRPLSKLHATNIRKQFKSIEATGIKVVVLDASIGVAEVKPTWSLKKLNQNCKKQAQREYDIVVKEFEQKTAKPFHKVCCPPHINPPTDFGLLATFPRWYLAERITMWLCIGVLAFAAGVYTHNLFF